MPRTSAIQTSSTANGSVTNCGTITPLDDLGREPRALAQRLGDLQQHELLVIAARDPGVATQPSSPADLVVAQPHRTGVGDDIVGRCRKPGSPLMNCPSARRTVEDLVGIVGAQQVAGACAVRLNWGCAPRSTTNWPAPGRC